MLDGPYDESTSLMRDELRSRGLLPILEPYTALGQQFRGGGGGETIDPAILLNEGEDAIVDWVVVEIRDKNDPGRCIASRCALIQRDGDIVDLDGLNPVVVCVGPGQYHVAVRHRNHMAIMTGSPVEFLSGQFGLVYAELVDLSSPEVRAYRNSESRKALNGVMLLWSGDVNFDGLVKYTGIGNDRDLVLQAIGGTVATNVVDSTYAQTDVNLNSQVKYTGQANDRDEILQTIGGSVATNFREGYVPKDSLTVRPNVHVMDDLPLTLDTTRSDLDSNTVLVYSVNDVLPQIGVGHIAIGSDPGGGYLRKVVSASAINDSLYLTTVQGKLTDVYSSGMLSFEIPDDAGQNFAQRALSYAENQQLFSAGGVSVSLEDISINYSGTPYCELDFEDFEVKTAEVGIKNINVGLDYELKFEGTLFNDSIERTFFELEVNRGAVLLPGGIPLWWVTVLEVAVEAKVEIFGEVNTSTEVSVDLNATIGASYDRVSGYNSINTFELPSPHLTSKVTEVAVGLRASVSLQAEVQCKFYKVGGPYFSTGPEGEITLRSTAFIGGANDHDIKAEAKWSTSAGVKAELMGLESDHAFTYETDPFIEFTSPSRLDTIAATGKRQIGELGEPLNEPLKVKVLSKRHFPFLPTSEEGAWLIPVNFQVTSGGGSLSEERVYTDMDGFAETSWTLGDSIVEPQRVLAFVLNGVGDTIPMAYVFKADTAELRLEYVSGDEQIGSVNSELPNPLVVRILDQNEQPVEGYPVHFDVTAGNGQVSEDLVPTNSEGLASTMFTLGSLAADQHKVSAYALTFWGDTIADAPRSFKAYIDPDTMMYAQLSGNYQTGAANTVLPVDLRVHIQSVLGQEDQEDVLVYFEVVSGGGSVSSFGTSTNSVGIASVAWTLGPDLTIRQKVKAWALDVYGDTLRGGPLEFEACTIICPLTVTDIDGNVYPVVKIGCDCWLQENLRTHRFNNGDPIQALDMNAVHDFSGYVFWFDLPIFNLPSYTEDLERQHDGLAYNVLTILDVRNPCPSGWHRAKWSEIGRIIETLGINLINTLPPSGPFRAPEDWQNDPFASNFTGFTLKPGRCPTNYDLVGSNSVRLTWNPFWSMQYHLPWTATWFLNEEPDGVIDTNGQNNAFNIETQMGNTSLSEGPPIYDGWAYCRCVQD